MTSDANTGREADESARALGPVVQLVESMRHEMTAVRQRLAFAATVPVSGGTNRDGGGGSDGGSHNDGGRGRPPEDDSLPSPDAFGRGTHAGPDPVMPETGAAPERECGRGFELEARLGRIERGPRAGRARFVPGVSPAFFRAAFDMACAMDQWESATEAECAPLGTARTAAPLAAQVDPVPVPSAEESHAYTWRWSNLSEPVRTTVRYAPTATAGGSALVEHLRKTKLGHCDLAARSGPPVPLDPPHSPPSSSPSAKSADGAGIRPLARLSEREQTWDVRVALASETPLMLPASVPHAVRTQRMAIRQRQRFVVRGPCPSGPPAWAIDFTVVWVGRTRTEAEHAQHDRTKAPEFHIEWEYVGGHRGLEMRTDEELADELMGHVRNMLSLADYWDGLERYHAMPAAPSEDDEHSLSRQHHGPTPVAAAAAPDQVLSGDDRSNVSVLRDGVGTKRSLHDETPMRMTGDDKGQRRKRPRTYADSPGDGPSGGADTRTTIDAKAQVGAKPPVPRDVTLFLSSCEGAARYDWIR